MQQDKKVTLYLPPELHRRLKIRSAIDAESMSALVEKAIVFYLENPEVVDEVGTSYGKTHLVYNCPECTSAVVLQDGNLVSLASDASVLAEELPVEKVREEVNSRNVSQTEEQLVGSALIG
jgi:hypothetical protein